MITKEGDRQEYRRGEILLRLARNKIENVLGISAGAGAGVETPQDLGTESWLEADAATFVTLRQRNGELRGCIGSLEARRPLLEDVRRNAHSAAFNDPRFSPLSAEELAEVVIEVSVLSPTEPIECTNEEDLLAQLRPGVDGLVIESAFHRGTFLPQVWEQFAEPRDFVRALKRKAGLGVDEWPEGVKVCRYSVRKWQEGGLEGSRS